jgi:hypothetical protein
MIRGSTSKKVYRKIRKTVLFDSRDRDPRFTQSKYTIKLPRVYENVYSIILRSAEIPYTWYNFSQPLGNASFVMSVTVGDVTSPETQIVIPDGNYSCESFPCVIAHAINEVFGITPLSETPFTVTYDSTTNKLTISATDPLILGFTLHFNPTSNPQKKSICSNNFVGLTTPTSTWWGLGYFMGFYRKDYTVSGSSLSITSDFAVQFYPFKYIIMELDYINKQDETLIDGRLSGRIDGCFAKIPLMSTPCEPIFYRELGCCNMNESIMNPPISQLSQLSVKWRFHDGTPIDFNNADHSFSLEFYTLESNFDEYSSIDLAPL